MGKNQETVTSKGTNILALGTEIIGEIKTDGDIRLDGKLKGNLTAQGKIVLGATGIIDGDINCKNALIEGKLDGKIVVAELLSLSATAKVHGEVITAKLAVESGAIFTGTCKMDEVPLPNGNNNKK